MACLPAQLRELLRAGCTASGWCGPNTGGGRHGFDSCTLL